jgi:hypothetical protein
MHSSLIWNDPFFLRWVGLVARMREKINAYMLLVWRLEGRRQLDRPRYKCEDNIEIEIELENMNNFHIAQYMLKIQGIEI